MKQSTIEKQANERTASSVVANNNGAVHQLVDLLGVAATPRGWRAQQRRIGETWPGGGGGGGGGGEEAAVYLQSED